MRNFTVQEKLWHTPLILSVHVQGRKINVPLDKRFLNICKHQVKYGHSAELFKEGDLSVVYTCLREPGHAFISVQCKDIDVGVLAIQGRAYEETFSKDSKTLVNGFSALAEAIVSRLTVVPQIQLSSFMTEPIPSYSSLKYCKQVLQNLNLSISRPQSEYHIRAFNFLLREKLIRTSTENYRQPRRRFTGLASAHCMLKFNNNFVSRMVSANSTQNLFQARGQCLNVAAAQAASLPPLFVFLGSTLESIPVAGDAYTHLSNIPNTRNPAARVAYLNSLVQKQKIPVYALQEPDLELLAASNIKSKKRLPMYVAYTIDKTPILLGDLCLSHSNNESASAAAHRLKKQGELFTRRWIAAACNYHPELTSALCILSRAVAPKEGSILGYNPIPALDMWANFQMENEMYRNKK